jgi:hypothetical protein
MRESQSWRVKSRKKDEALSEMQKLRAEVRVVRSTDAEVFAAVA